MAAAARRAGVYLIVVSGYRSDAEQARLFAPSPILICFACSGPSRGDADPPQGPSLPSVTSTSEGARLPGTDFRFSLAKQERHDREW